GFGALRGRGAGIAILLNEPFGRSNPGVNAFLEATVDADLVGDPARPQRGLAGLVAREHLGGRWRGRGIGHGNHDRGWGWRAGLCIQWSREHQRNDQRAAEQARTPLAPTMTHAARPRFELRLRFHDSWAFRS